MMFSGFAQVFSFAPLLCPAGHCINITLSYTFVSGPHGPTAGKSFNRVQHIFIADRPYSLAGHEELENSNAGIHFIHLYFVDSQ